MDTRRWPRASETVELEKSAYVRRCPLCSASPCLCLINVRILHLMHLYSPIRFISVLLLLTCPLFAQKYDYRLLATSKTASMEKEMNQAADAGFVFGSVMGGESSIGGKEVLVVMVKNLTSPVATRKYSLLTASKTGTLQKELQQAGDEGFAYCGQTVFESTFGGREVSIILEQRPSGAKEKRIEYKLLATSKTSTMEKELKQAGDAGFEFLGVVIGKTALGGKEVISILQKVGK